jgi:lipid A 4'-phosphatase
MSDLQSKQSRFYWTCVLAAFAVPAFAAGFFPGVDLAVSGFFYQAGRGFVRSPVLEWLHHAGPGIVVAAALAAALGLWRSGRLTFARAGFVPAVFLLGPGLLVNALLKEHYGRARPVQVEAFGGAAHFTSALQIADQCHHNCSFTAGDPSAGFALIAFALLLPEKRGVFTALALGLGSALGLMRVAQGGHFFSDVMFTAVATMGSAVLLFSIWPGKAQSSSAAASRR